MESLVVNLVCEYAHLLRHRRICSITVASFLLERGGRLSWLCFTSVLLLGSCLGFRVKRSSAHIPDCWKGLPYNCPRPLSSIECGVVKVFHISLWACQRKCLSIVALRYLTHVCFCSTVVPIFTWTWYSWWLIRWLYSTISWVLLTLILNPWHSSQS